MAYTAHTSLTIPDGGTTTPALDLSDYLLSGIVCPAEFDGTTITFTAARTPEGTYRPVYNTDGTALTVTTAASRHIAIVPETFAGVRYVKLVAGTAQTGATTLTLVLVDL